jgi:hypothetical protein
MPSISNDTSLMDGLRSRTVINADDRPLTRDWILSQCRAEQGADHEHRESKTQISNVHPRVSKQPRSLGSGLSSWATAAPSQSPHDVDGFRTTVRTCGRADPSEGDASELDDRRHLHRDINVQFLVQGGRYAGSVGLPFLRSSSSILF